MNAAYRMSRLYVFHCGFSLMPHRYRSKQRLFAGTTFQQRPPTLDNLTHWFAGRPANIGIALGAISDNLCVLDFDDFRTWSTFHALTGWDGPVVSTSRGVHVYVRVKDLPAKNGQGYFEGLLFGEVLAHGTITAPPSVHPSGAVYQWHGSPVRLPFLSSLADIGVECRNVQGERPRVFQKAQQRAGREHINSSEAYVSAAIRGECQKILTAIEGSRHNQLYESALKLAKYTNLTSAGEISAHLQAAAVQAGLDAAKIKNTIYRGLSQGRSNGVL